MLRISVIALLASALALGGCAAKVTKVDMALEGSGKLNPDLNGRPSPVVIRVMELKHPVAFENAEFFSLYQQPRETLTPDYIGSEELELRPGEVHDLTFTAQEEARYLGVMAAYRDLSEANWRFVVPLNPKKQHNVRLYLDEKGIVEVPAQKKGRK